LLYFWYERRYKSVAHVKTAISLDESLFQEAEEWAGKLGISRSRLFARAVEEYVRRQETEELVRRLDEAHAGEPDEEDVEALRHGQALFAEMLRRAEREGRQ
jgi:predicted transcriptional regulator